MQATIEQLPEGQLEIKLTPETEAEYQLAAAWARQHADRAEIMEAMRAEISAARRAKIERMELQTIQAAVLHDARQAKLAEAAHSQSSL